MDDRIKEFLEERKSNWIKKKSNPAMTADEALVIEQEAAHAFTLEHWLPDAAKRASQLSLVTHPSKFSHPDSKTTPLMVESKRTEDGFLRTGNANAALDVFGNAAAMDVFKFLSLQLSDGITILEHLQCNSQKIQDELKLESVSFDELSAGFLSIKKGDSVAATDERVKQVYFPVANDYHLLSVLTPSGLVFELRNRIQSMRFSDETKFAREDKKKNTYNTTGFDDLYNLSIIGYGGTKPQNISVLNSTYGGKAYLLPSLPPLLSKQKIRLPKHNFFTNCLWPKNFEEKFIKIHKLLATDYNNKTIRDGLTYHIQSVIDEIIEQMWAVRIQGEGWSAKTNYAQLPSHQKIWLDESVKEDRQISDEWLNKIIAECAIWIVNAYKKVLGNQAIMLADTELAYVKSIIELNKEDLR